MIKFLLFIIISAQANEKIRLDQLGVSGGQKILENNENYQKMYILRNKEHKKKSGLKVKASRDLKNYFESKDNDVYDSIMGITPSTLPFQLEFESNF